MRSAPLRTIDDLIALYRSPEAQALYDEVVTEQEHALQCAACGVADGAPDALVIAALFHDVGHLVVRDNVPLDATLDRDHHHDRAGAAVLGRWFDERVTEPVRLHVTAKRYLCAVEPEYHDALSPSSVRSLDVQGGPMSATEIADFEAAPWASDAVALRRWDDRGKQADLVVRPIESFRPMIDALVVSG
jgi:gamma-butyrobetaine dioxygenase